MHWLPAQYAQVGLLGIYLILAFLFMKQKQYAIAAYYVGCVVKDAAVFVIALFGGG